MCNLKFIFLIVQLICGSFLLAQSSQNQWIIQLPAQYLFTSKDYQSINDFVLQKRNPSTLYYSPMVANNYLLNAKQSNNNASLKSKQSFEKAHWRDREISHKKKNLDYLSSYLKPPVANYISNYTKFQNYTSNEDEKETNILSSSHTYDTVEENKKSLKNHQDQRLTYIRDHASIHQNKLEQEETLENKISINKKFTKKEPLETSELSADRDRIEFQIQGHKGPKTYIFGFDTGDGMNRQFRLEEKLKDGTVKGHYGYYDAKGKLRTIKYLAQPFEGYQEKHHESNILINKGG